MVCVATSIESIEVLALMPSLMLRSGTGTEATKVMVVHELVRPLRSARGWEEARTSLMLASATTIASEATSATLRSARKLVHLRLIVVSEVALGLLTMVVTWQVVMALADFVRSTPTLVARALASRVATIVGLLLMLVSVLPSTSALVHRG